MITSMDKAGLDRSGEMWRIAIHNAQTKQLLIMCQLHKWPLLRPSYTPSYKNGSNRAVSLAQIVAFT